MVHVVNRSAALAVVVVLVSGACAPGPGTTPPPADALTEQAVDLVTDSGAQPARRLFTTAAEEEVTRRCMAALGETYRPYVPPLAAGDDEHRLVDLPKRRSRGYEFTSPVNPPSVGPDAKRPAFQKALFGDGSRDLGLTLPDASVVSFPSSGCVAQGRAAVYTDVVRWARVDSIPQVIGNRLRDQVSGSPELAAATRRWASCMRSKGLPYARPAAAREAAGVPAREVTIAVADGECDLQAHLTGTELALRRQAATRLPAADRRELNDLASTACTAAKEAAHILIRPVPTC
ncbi:hypothetical protein [Micromonospora sp. NPDC048898]|uniref:hypothetical protein n=1 Tax=Micromonospora sp. NPDC048898 TaxID=3364260 RepID=UPI0037134000